MKEKKKKADLQEIEQAIQVLHEPGQVVEIRALGESGTVSGYYDEGRSALEQWRQFRGRVLHA